jgi:hypothetical protein
VANAQAKYVIKLEDKTKRAFKAIGKSLKRTTSAVFSMKTGFVSAAGIAGIGYFVKKSLDATDEMAKMSRAIGVSVENLQRLRHAASLGGLEATQLDKAVQKLSVNMADMSKGIGLAKDVFDKYNISVTNSDGTLRDTVDVMADVADVTAGLTNKTEKADLAYKLFGARGGKMINVLEGGSVAMREAMMEADKLGLVITENTAKGVEKANDAFTRLGSYLTSSFHRAVANLAPLIEKITNGIREWVEMKIDKAGGIGEVARSMANMVILATVSIVKAIQNVGNAIFNLGRQFEQLPFMGAKSTKKLKKEIGDLEGYILATKSRIADGGISGIFGMDESTLESQLKKLGELKEQLKNSKNTFTNIEAIDLSHIVSSLESMLIPVQQTTEAADKLKDSLSLGGDEDGLSSMKTGLEEFKETFNTAFSTMEDKGKSAWQNIGSSMASIFGNGGTLSTSLGKSTADLLVYGKKGDMTFKKLGQSIMASVVGSLVQSGVQMAINAVKEKMFGAQSVATAIGIETAKTGAYVAGQTARTATSVTAAATETAAWTPAALMSSLASFGANAVMAIAGIMAVSALMKSFDGGGFTGGGARSGGVDGKGGFMAVMHPNETVIDHTKGQSAGGQTVIVNYSPQVNALDPRTAQNVIAENAPTIVAVIRQAFNRNGQAVAI